MPIWLRKFTFNEMNSYYEELNKKQTKSKSITESTPLRPDISPTYKSNRSKN